MISIDLNADVGEGFGPWSLGDDDESLFSTVTSVNIACGFHAGDPRVMDRAVSRAVRSGAAIGAHPGYWDLRGFGRREMKAEPGEVENDVLYQVGALAAFARSHGVRLVHVKPHGALYSQAARDAVLAGAIARGVRRADERLFLVGLASSEVMRRAAEDAGLRFAGEAFADRSYEADGALRSRGEAGAVLSDPEAAARQAVRLAREGRVTTHDGREVALRAETLCIHGDTPGAAMIARAVRDALEAAGVALRPLTH
ncbi:MAG: LamB/YcsF family protein [Vicinamibacteria bacterium]